MSKKKGRPRVVTRTIKALKSAAAALTDLADRYHDAFAPEFLNELTAFTAWLDKFSATLAATDFTKAEKSRGRK